MSESMAERVAAAIKKSHDVECGELGTTMDEKTASWLARAAIQAMREPTEEMIAAGERPFDEPFTGGRLTPASAVYESMIDAALTTDESVPPHVEA